MNSTGNQADVHGDQTDVIVLGVGTCGEDLSLQLLDAGLDVVGIEANLVGGTCPFYGCLPSKMMIRGANLLKEADRVKNMSGQSSVSSNWNQISGLVRQLTGGWKDKGAVERYEKRGGRLIHGQGKLTGSTHCYSGRQKLYGPKRSRDCNRSEACNPSGFRPREG